MRFKLLLDRILDDGRFVVINSSTDGNSPGPEHSALVLSGAFNIPLGTRFTELVLKRSVGANDFVQFKGERVSLKLTEIEFFRAKTDTVPAGHNAAVRLEGKGMELVCQQLAAKSNGFHVYLVANDTET